jgi:hypothetical protein
MSYWRDIWRIVKNGKTSTYRSADGATVIADGGKFRGLSLSRHEDIVEKIQNEQLNLMMQVTGKKTVNASQVRDSAQSTAASLIEYKPGATTAMVIRVKDSIRNDTNIYNSPGQDPTLDSFAMPNLYIDPGEAASIYSQGGIPALIINKKSKSIAHNDVRIANPRLSQALMDKVNESAHYRTGLATVLAAAGRDGLVYGGSLLFPFFKNDSPATMLMDIKALMKYDVIRKDCVDRYVNLDRNNAIHIPNWDPTAADFLNPKKYFIPYLGNDVNGQRCARVVPVPQAGYWGAIMTMGWGNSDIQGWYQAVCNYDGVMSAVPSMIRQMSLLVRTFNVDLSNALNGATSLSDIDRENTLVVRQASVNNPISMDVIGDLQAIKRDFTAVAELTRIIRQDVGARANMPEEQLWSSDRGAFSSGDQSEGANERQWEGIKYIHNEISSRCKNIAMIEIVNTLGKDREILSALPYTTIEFMTPKIESAEKRATIIRDLAESAFNLVASGMQLDSALKIVLPYGDAHLAPSAAIVDEVHKHQVEVDEREKEKHEAEMKLSEAQVKSTEEGAATAGAAKVGSGGGYTKLEQRKKEKTRGGAARREGVQRAQGKKI